MSEIEDSLKKILKFIDPYKKNFLSWYGRNNKNKYITKIGGGIIIIFLGNAVLFGGEAKIKLSNGSTVKFKKENVSCRKESYSDGNLWYCSGSGVIKNLAGYKYTYNKSSYICAEALNGKKKTREIGMGEPVCIAAEKFNKL
tara:strand:- start:88 stop:513 length:426 start_codon:yes stop_codon:yes gene_type:complete